MARLVGSEDKKAIFDCIRKNAGLLFLYGSIFSKQVTGGLFLFCLHDVLFLYARQRVRTNEWKR
jgi:hypothetical protein